MQFLRTLTQSTSQPLAARAVSIGNFDGVHLGHQQLLARLQQASQASGLVATVLTFEPHPKEWFAPKQVRQRIHLLRDKAAALAKFGVETLVIAPFAQIHQLSGQAFIEQILLAKLNTKFLVVGDDFHFGKGRDGDITLLERYAAQGAFALQQVHSFSHQQQRVSSSAVRAALQHADFALTQKLLGRRYSMSGHVLHGKKLGRSLGYPTLNLRIHHNRPALSGIFCVLVHGLGPKAKPAVASLGTRPTVEKNGDTLLEVYVLDWQGDAYGRLIEVEFLHKIRDEQTFVDLRTLEQAIAQDVQQARDFFAQTSATRLDARERI